MRWRNPRQPVPAQPRRSPRSDSPIRQAVPGALLSVILKLSAPVEHSGIGEIGLSHADMLPITRVEQARSLSKITPTQHYLGPHRKYISGHAPFWPPRVVGTRPCHRQMWLCSGKERSRLVPTQGWHYTCYYAEAPLVIRELDCNRE